MVFFDRTKEEILNRSLELLSRNTNITQLTPGSKTRFLLEVYAAEQGEQHKIFDENIMQSFIKYADSRFLEFFGDMLNLPRNEPVHAYVDDNNFMFYVQSGTFGDINNNVDFTIPAGTTISTVPFDEPVITPGITAQTKVEYVTTSDVQCLANQSFVYAPIRATVEGSAQNVPKNTLLQHNFASYVLSSTSRLKSTNRYSITTGRNRESNFEYRFRLSNVFRAREMATYAAIRLAALSVPGVSDVKLVLCEQGTGTFSIYIKSTAPTTSPQLLQEVSVFVTSVAGYGNRPYILAPEPLGLEFTCAVNWSKVATDEQINQGYRDMRDALENRLNNTDIAESIELSDLIDLLLSSSRYAISIGDKRANHFEEVYAYRNDQYTGGTIRNFLTGDEVIPLSNERIILETSGRYRGIRFLTRQAS